MQPEHDPEWLSLTAKMRATIDSLPPGGVTLGQIRDLIGREGLMLLTAFLTIIFLDRYVPQYAIYDPLMILIIFLLAGPLRHASPMHRAGVVVDDFQNGIVAPIKSASARWCR